MCINICLVEDAPYHDTLKSVVNKRFSRQLKYIDILSLPIATNGKVSGVYRDDLVASDSYGSIFLNLSKFNCPHGLIIVLDLALSLDLENHDFSKYPDIAREYELLFNSLQGTELKSYVFSILLAKKAIENQHLQHCLVLVNSSNVPRNQMILIESYLCNFSISINRHKNVSVKCGFGRPLSTDDECSKVIEEAYDLFSQKYLHFEKKVAFDLLDVNFRHQIPHPNDKHSIPRQINCYFIFHESTISESNLLESFKALFDPNKLNGPRQIHVEIMSSLLEFADIKINIQNRTSIDMVRLPCQPGILFFVNLVAFLKSMGIKSVDFTHNMATQEATICFQPKEILRFSSALLSGEGGESISRFQSLITCAKDIVYEDENQVKPYKLNSIFDEWSSGKSSAILDRARADIKVWNPQPLPSKHDHQSIIYPASIWWQRNWMSNIDNNVYVKWKSFPSSSQP
jgi:hypothetical protein